MLTIKLGRGNHLVRILCEQNKIGTKQKVYILYHNNNTEHLAYENKCRNTQPRNNTFIPY